METHDDANEKTGYNLRSNRERSYKHLYDPNVFNTNKSSNDREGVMMTTINGGSEETGQMSMRKGLKVFGEPGYAAVKKEMQQLHDRKVMQPVDQKDLSQSQKKEALGYLMFLQKKRCVIQFPPKMDENWVRYELLNGGQISRTKLAEDAVLCVHNTASALNR